MTTAGNSQILRTIPLLITIFSLSLPAYAKYSGGTGEPNDPYQIATAEDLMLLGETPEDYDKHFILTADIDLDPNLPGRKVFDRAVMAPDTNDLEAGFQGTPFTGVFNGNGTTISHLTIAGKSYLGLFGHLESEAMISNLGFEAVEVNGAGEYAGGLVGKNRGNIGSSYSTGTVSGNEGVGGLVGWNYREGSVTASYSMGTVIGDGGVGGLVGKNSGSIGTSFSASVVSGTSWHIGGLVGDNNGDVTNCYSTGSVSGQMSSGHRRIGGLVGLNNFDGTIISCYSTGHVSGEFEVGGLVGKNFGSIGTSQSIGRVTGGRDVGGLVGGNGIYSEETYAGMIFNCCSVGEVIGENMVGGLVGINIVGSITTSYSTGTVGGDEYVGGLVGWNYLEGSVTASYNTGTIIGNEDVGGLVGANTGGVSDCYSTGAVTGNERVGGLVGYNSYSCVQVGHREDYIFGQISNSYSTGLVTGDEDVGGFVGKNSTSSNITVSFWDIETSGQLSSSDGFGLTTAEMQTASTFIDAGWDFVGETVNGPNNIWKMWDGYDYPRLIWEFGPNTPLVFVDINDPNFYGQMSKYEVTNAQYCDFLNAAMASGDITIDGNDVYGAGGSNSGEDYTGQRYYRCDGSGYTGYGATNGGAARIHYNQGAFSVDEGFGNHPVTYVSWYGAMAFANYYGYYLPTEDQWQAVADYDGTYIYGCGETIDLGIANYRVSEHPDGTTTVGSFGIYGYGMSDMAGNVWEWTSSSLDDNRIFRGGSLGSYDSDCAVSVRGDGIPHANYYDIGFRVCR